jgi:hypothetical protein
MDGHPPPFHITRSPSTVWVQRAKLLGKFTAQQLLRAIRIKILKTDSNTKERRFGQVVSAGHDDY